MAVQHGKKYQSSRKLVEEGKLYPPAQAVALAKQASYASFDETLGLHFRLGVDPRHADQQVRGVALLPHGVGREVKVAVFAQGEAAQSALGAGADYVGADDLVKRVEEGWTDFTVAIATPDMMGKVGRLGKVLGRKGLMPNPKSGTVVPPPDIARAVADARKGRAEFRIDKSGIIHAPIGRKSFQDQQLMENMSALVDAVVKARPAGAKGQYVKSINLTLTMGPAIKLELGSMLEMAKTS
ncbi:MAG: 50S ribosomal protein L1 [Dehalococcoidia bacterium]|nr:50S ribosomal protein L1 [Dehalococcoidia bacterium]